MGEIAASLADFVIVTSDNPRTEEPASIIEDILEGMKGTKTPYKVIENRQKPNTHRGEAFLIQKLRVKRKPSDLC